jgi:drug/metabolite transporter (DMT)-like permease
MERPALLVASAAVLYGLILPSAQYFADMGLSVYEIALLPILCNLVILGPLALREGLSRRHLPTLALYGLIGAALQLSQFGSIVMGLPIAAAAMLLSTQPLWSLALGRLLLGEGITRGKLLACLMALAGVAVLLAPSLAGGYRPAAALLGALSGLFLSLWVVWGRRCRVAGMTSVGTAAGFATASAVWLLVLHPVLVPLGEWARLAPPLAPLGWGYLFLLATVSGTIPHLLFYTGMERTQASRAGVILLLEPLSASLIGIWLFGKPLTPNILAGGALILASNYRLAEDIQQG